MRTTTGELRPRHIHQGLTKGQAEALRRDAFALAIAPVLRELRAAGGRNNRQLAAGLNRRGVPSESGRSWTLHATASVKYRFGGLADLRRRAPVFHSWKVYGRPSF